MILSRRSSDYITVDKMLTLMLKGYYLDLNFELLTFNLDTQFLQDNKESDLHG